MIRKRKGFVMKFECYTSTKMEQAVCKEDFASADGMNNVFFGDKAVYLKKLTKILYIPYADMDRIFRRVMQVPVKMCCGRGDLEIQYLVIMKEDKQIIELQVPSKTGAVILFDEVKKRAPQLQFTRP